MTLKQLWMATVTLLLTVMLSQPEALANLTLATAESLVWMTLSLLEHLAEIALNP